MLCFHTLNELESIYFSNPINESVLNNGTTYLQMFICILLMYF